MNKQLTKLSSAEELRRNIQSQEIDKLRPVNIGLNVGAGTAMLISGASGLLALSLIGSDDPEEIKDRNKLAVVSLATGVAGVAAMRQNRHYAKKYARNMSDATYMAGYRRGVAETLEEFENIQDRFDDLEGRMDSKSDVLDEISEKLNKIGGALDPFLSNQRPFVSEEGKVTTTPYYASETSDDHSVTLAQADTTHPVGTLLASEWSGFEEGQEAPEYQEEPTDPFKAREALGQQLAKERERRQAFQQRMAEERAEELGLTQIPENKTAAEEEQSSDLELDL